MLRCAPSLTRVPVGRHPDKNPDPRAKELFQKYANAYDVLSSAAMRDNYDYLLDHPYEFPMHFMRFSRAK